MLDILVNVLGWQMVSQALRNREKAKRFSIANPALVGRHCLILSNTWKLGKAKEYLDSLDVDLRNCLICNLVGNISADVIRDYGLQNV